MKRLYFKYSLFLFYWPIRISLLCFHKNHKMNILLLGSGGREHALAWKLAKSPLTTRLYIAPGNPGTEQTGININLNLANFYEIGSFCLEHSIQLVIVGPEEPLVNGIYDYFKNDLNLRHISILGPSKDGAQLEGSKDFAKHFMQEFNIPTAAYRTFDSTNIEEAIDYINSYEPPYVIKADGLAAGKGVIIPTTRTEAIDTLKDMLLNKRFGASSDKVVIEKFLKGIELSVFVLTDGQDWLLLPEAKDYKKIGIGDTGPNTGGMGSVSPVSFADKSFMDKVIERIIKPTIEGLKQRKIDYKGFVFFGLINVDGNPFVIEYNVRMGDPETESVIPRIKSDLVNLLKACADGKLKDERIIIDNQAAATVVLVSGGYPGEYKKGFPISDLEIDHSSLIFHAGTKTDPQKGTVTSGGRVFAITSLANTVSEALNLSFETSHKIDFEGKYFREDIGFDLI